MFASSSALDGTCVFDITLSEGGGGTATVSADESFECNSVYLASYSGSLNISISDGVTTWTDSHLLSKHGTPPYGNLELNGNQYGLDDVIWDDPDNGSGDPDIAVFTNTSVLAFTEGDLGSRAYRIDSNVVGTYSISVRFVDQAIAVPTLSQWSTILMLLLIAGFGMTRLHRTEL
jgi:hypothetical protein